MGRITLNSKKTIQTVVLIVSICLGVFIVYLGYKEDGNNDYLRNVSVSSRNHALVVSWDIPDSSNITKIQIQISGDNYSNIQEIVSHKSSYIFTEGKSGEKYNFSIAAEYKDGRIGNSIEKQGLFLDDKDIPDLPVFYIYTSTGEEPMHEKAENPEDLWGETIINNEYVIGNFLFYWRGHETISAEMKIRVRGNTSTVNSDKKSYKIKLKQSIDLMNRSSDYADTEWLLLNCGTNLNNYVGEYFSNLCGVEWSPHYMFVNVVLNGDWKGLYVLSESVNRAVSRGNVSDSGYIFENDAYFWNSNGLYFKVDNQIEELGFTFKYPEIEDADDTRICILQNYMQLITDMIINRDPIVWDYINADSFASWIMVRDILHQGDGGGSNMYYYIYDLDVDNYTANKLKMGPVWDYDSGLKGSEKWIEDTDSWSTQHDSTYSYFSYLFDTEYFSEIYKEKWENLPQDSINVFFDYLEKLYIEQGGGIMQSRILDAERWDGNSLDLRDEIDYIKKFIENRFQWISKNI